MVERFIKTEEVCYLVGLGRHTIAAMVKRGEFPKSAKIGKRTNGWRYSDVLNWINERADQKEVKDDK